MKWVVEIRHTSLDRRNLDDLLRGLGYSLVSGIQYLAFTSSQWDKFETAAEVYENAKLIRSAFTGPAQIDPSFILGAVINYSVENHKRYYFLEAETGFMKQSAGTVSITRIPPEGISDDELKDWNDRYAEMDYQMNLEHQRTKLEPAFYNSRAVKILTLLSNKDPSAEEIYKIYELAEGHPNKRDAFHIQFGITNDQFNRFRDAVHNPKVSGDWARHAYEETPRTINPMSKEEAVQFVRNIAIEWLKYVREMGIKD